MKEKSQAQEIQELKTKLRYKQARLLTVTALLKQLKRGNNSNNALEEILLRKFSGFNLELLKNITDNYKTAKKRRCYSKKIKELASTLYFYSPKAYKFVRSQYVYLPRQSILKKWVGEASCEPGFIKEVFDFLKEEAKKSEFVRDVGLIFDAMAIRTQEIVDNKENTLRGRVDYGNAATELKLQINSNDFVKEVLAFQIVSYKHAFKMPIAHFIINGITATNQNKLLDLTIKKLYDVGITVHTLTSDGSQVNLSTYELLGCNFKLDEMKTFFKHPNLQTDIHVIMDPYAISYLRDHCKLKEFYGSEATTEFLYMFDRIFDLMNSRNIFGKDYNKTPLKWSNLKYWNEIFVETEQYIRTLRGQVRKTFALGFLINICSFRNFAMYLLCPDGDKCFTYFLTYKCSQDQIELYFSCLRLRGGWNNNPNIMQVLWSVRRLFYRNSVEPSINSNCLSEGFELSPAFEFWKSTRALQDVNCTDRDNRELKNLMMRLEHVELSYYQRNILYYIAGNVTNKFMQKFQCSYCHKIVVASSHSKDHNYYNFDSGFLDFVNRGKLKIPSKCIFETIIFCEKAFKTEITVGFNGNINFKNKITAAAIKQFMPLLKTLFKPDHPIVETSNLCEEIKIIKFVVALYTKIRLYAYAKTNTLKYLGSKATLRQKLSKTILFLHV
ncbi:THAP domain-containing protein 9 [Cyphomyrmex costatus]|uniref:THAP domain-containing protein 9 n=1 Tax=Cyphomyrmex costatus TaxID=456900 RepID=A0A151IK08_9HYME|nr:THAP domain-containing protein 9 [Cyphomyrmex costatus]